ncbi:general substrate transporter [Aspergillus saccharolyticus JOP 1030-1]|uniref:General substrate transporter n=1 Tax=Aspergillus saccharolyticus JOP 1030-1 TaxID=1450539 RepID=A0A318Z0Y1_9EURO|nr:general substrate transporter [Aspergillus saccharolyticus JOP 1030-1]PYH40569.1 general substrate transporter [Aspergillus saccharolyticus JOP 1030-1]
MKDHHQHSLFQNRLSFRLLCAAFCFGFSGAARGLDGGLIASTVAEQSFIDQFHLHANYLNASEKANRLSDITSMVHIGSLPGALVAFISCERIGMLWTMRQACLLWITGSIIFITSHTLGQVYAGRFIMGLGIGQYGVIAPIYLGEVAPREIRGMIVGMYGMSEYLGIMIGYFSIWGASLHIPSSSARQWIIPQSIQIMWAGLLLLGSLFCEESPRFLCKTGRPKAALRSFARLWNLSLMDPGIHVEMANAQAQIEQADKNKSFLHFLSALKELFTTKDHLRRIAYIFALQCLGEWSGPNSVTTYAPELFELFGIEGRSQKLFTTAILGAVKFASALISALFLLDALGRRKTLYLGLIIQILALAYDSIFLTVFEYLTPSSHQESAVKHAAIGAIVMIYMTGLSWALGWNSIQYLIPAEAFPLRVRIVGVSLVTLWHYVNRIGISKATPMMLLAHHSLTPVGTFWFFTGISLLGLLFVWFFVPETSGKGLEETNTLYTSRRHLLIPHANMNDDMKLGQIAELAHNSRSTSDNSSDQLARRR